MSLQQIRAVKGHYLYNMLQDFRHLLIIDLRSKENFTASQIRNSFNLDEATTKEQLEHVIILASKQADEKEKKYPQLKKVRRFFFIDSKDIDCKNCPQSLIARLELALNLIPKDPVNKFYSLSGGYDEFNSEYPFMSLREQQFNKLKQNNATETELHKFLLYPYSKFPAEIIIGKLYLGNLYSSNSQKQLEDLKIKCLIDFIDYSQDASEQGDNIGKAVPDFKHDQSKYSYMNLAFNTEFPVEIDFDIINAEIDKKLNEGRVLLYCKDGESISAAFAIAYLMYKSKLDLTMATLKVCQAISRTDITKWIYTQLLVYKPKK